MSTRPRGEVRESSWRRAAVAGVLCGLLLGACAAPGPRVEPPGLPEPAAVEVPIGPLGPVSELTHLPLPDFEAELDDLLTSPVMRDTDFRAAVDGWVEYWTETASSWVPDFLERMGHFEETVDSSLAAGGMPPSLRYLPFIESGYNPGARSRASAVGLWQLMPGTAGDLGLEVGPLVDERRDPLKSTSAALRFLGGLHGAFDSWFLALAAYNGGPGRARRILSRHAPDAEPTDSLFWALRDRFPRETREFVPKLIGAVIVASQPERYGYDVRPGPRFAFDMVEVPDATTLDVVARAAEVTEDEIEWLNPELVRGLTPPGRRFALRVPRGAGPGFDARYALIPEDERVSFVEHTVESGETLSHIAVRYRVSVDDLRAANPEIRPRYLRIGARLTVPLVPGAGSAP